MAELLNKGKEDADQRNAIAQQALRKQTMEDTQFTVGNVAEKVRIFATGKILKAEAKRPPSALDGAASSPPPKRVTVIKAPPAGNPPENVKPGFPEDTMAKMITKAKFVGEERGKDPVMKKPPGLLPTTQPIRPLVPKQPLVSIPEGPPAPPPGAPTGDRFLNHRRGISLKAKLLRMLEGTGTATRPDFLSMRQCRLHHCPRLYRLGQARSIYMKQETQQRPTRRMCRQKRHHSTT